MVFGIILLDIQNYTFKNILVDFFLVLCVYLSQKLTWADDIEKEGTLALVNEGVYSFKKMTSYCINEFSNTSLCT